MSVRPRIAVLVESSRGYGRGLLQGIASYAHEHKPWTIHYHERRLYDPVPQWLKRWRGDGVIARIGSLAMARQILKLRLPVVDLLGLYPNRSVPAIITHHQAVAQMAAEHLLSRGLTHFAYCGFAGIHFSERRGVYFSEYLAKRRFAVSTFDDHQGRRSPDPSRVEAESLPQTAEMATWLHSLPKPVGLMAATDYRGHQVLNVCGDQGIAVPDDVAVVGVDNDEVLCELSDPPLSSVALNPRKAGYEAAATLARMPERGARPKAKTLIPPLGVVMRRSTDTLGIPDADVAASLRLIREQACDGLTVDDVLANLHISRSTLKRRFAAVVRRSPREEIRRVQIDRVIELLTTTKLPLAEIAVRAGFQHVESMCKTFKHKTGLTPGQYRDQSAASPPAGL